MLLFLQTSSPPPSEPPPPPAKVELSDAQFAALTEQLQGAVFYLSAYLAVLCICVGALLLIRVIGGR